MLIDDETRLLLIDAIENNNFVEAFRLIALYPLAPPEKRVTFFIEHYTSKPQNWMEFWLAILNEHSSFSKQMQGELKRLIEDIVETACAEKLDELIISAITRSKLQSYILEILARSHQTADTVVRVLEVLQPDFAVNSYQQLVHLAVKSYNGILLQKLENIRAFSSAFQRTNLNPKECSVYEILKELDQSKCEYLNKKMKAFVAGFGYLQFSDILLALAQIKDRKKYEFNPIVINANDIEEIHEFISFLKEHKPIKVIFLLASEHYSVGVAEVYENSQANFWFIESLGQSSVHEDDNFQKILRVVVDSFEDYKIYVSKEKRLHAASGCSVFAIDDISHLHQLHLDAKYNETGMWGYLNDATKKAGAVIETLSDDEEEDLEESSDSLLRKTPIVVHFCELPLSLVRTMQSRSLLEKVIPGRELSEQHLCINKKGETAFESANKFFQETDHGRQNTRLNYKLKKMVDAVWKFLLQNNPDVVEEKMRDFTFSALKENHSKNTLLFR